MLLAAGAVKKVFCLNVAGIAPNRGGALARRGRSWPFLRDNRRGGQRQDYRHPRGQQAFASKYPSKSPQIHGLFDAAFENQSSQNRRRELHLSKGAGLIGPAATVYD